MNPHPRLTPKSNVPPAMQQICDRVHAVAEGLPTLVFIPNSDHSRLYPLVVVADSTGVQANQINSYLQGKQLSPPSTGLQEKHDLTLEAIHAAVEYLPVIAFLPDAAGLHPINLVPETVANHLKPCYRAVQQAQKTALGTQAIDVSSFAAERNSAEKNRAEKDAATID